MSQKISVLPGVPTNFPQVIRDKLKSRSPAPRALSKSRSLARDVEILESKTRQIAAIPGGIVSATLSTLPLLPLLFPYFARESVVLPG